MSWRLTKSLCGSNGSKQYSRIPISELRVSSRVERTCFWLARSRIFFLLLFYSDATLQVVSYLLVQNFYAAIQQRWMIHLTVVWHYLALVSSAGLYTSRSIPVMPAALLLLSFEMLKPHLTGKAMRGPTSIEAILLLWLAFVILAFQTTVAKLLDSILVGAASLRSCCFAPSPNRKIGVLSAFGLVLPAFGLVICLSGPEYGLCKVLPHGSVDNYNYFYYVIANQGKVSTNITAYQHQNNSNSHLISVTCFWFDLI